MSSSIRDSRGGHHGNTYLLVAVALACSVLMAACTADTEPVEAVISLDGSTEGLRTATIVVDYSQAGAAPLSNAGRPACTSILPHVSTEFSDDGHGTLTIEASSTRGFSGPVEVAACRMLPDVAGVAGSVISARLRVSLAGGTAVDGTKLEPQRLADARGRQRSAAATAPAGARTAAVGAGAGTSAAPTNVGAGRGEQGAGRPPAPGGDSSRMLLQRPELGDSGSARGRPATQPRTDRGDSQAPSAAGAQRDRSPSDAGGRVAPAPSGAKTPQAVPGAAGGSGNDETDAQEVASYLVQVGVTSESGLLGALQFDVDHLGSSGGWQGAGGSVNCAFDISAGLSQCNDKGRGRLTCALVDVSGFETPSAIATCTFKTADAVDAADFSVSVRDASDASLKPVEVTMDVIDLVRR